MLKNIFVYYLFIGLPLLGLILVGKEGFVTPLFFVTGILTYAIVYHPTVSGIRLLQGGIIKKSQWWNCFIPFWNQQYSSFLYLNK
jgi:hypothetical protein